MTLKRHVGVLFCVWSLLGLASTVGAQEGPGVQDAPSASDAAVVVGVSDYVFVSDIAGAADNATEWYTWLHKERGIALERIELLRDSDATVENLRDAVSKAKGKVGAGGTLWFVFVGHGAPGQDGNDGVLVGADAQQNPRSLYARSLSRTEVLKALDEGPQARSVAVLDTCFSGADTGGNPLIPNLQPLVPTAVEEAGQRTQVFTAAKHNQFAGPLPSNGRPAFSYLMLGALKGRADKNQDGAVTAQEAFDYSKHALAVTVRTRSQTPTLAGGDPGLVLSTGAGEAGPDLSILAQSQAFVSSPNPPQIGVQGGTLPSGPQQVAEVSFKFEYGQRFFAGNALSGNLVEFVYAKRGEDSDYVDFETGELSGTTRAHYLGIFASGAKQGFNLGYSMGVVLGTSPDANIRVDSDESTDSAQLDTALREGQELRVTGIYAGELVVDANYRLQLDRVGLSGHAGIGGYVGGMGLGNGPTGQPLDDTDFGSESAFLYGYNVPLSFRAEYRYDEAAAVAMGYTFQAYPFGAHTITVGIGPSYVGAPSAE